MKQIRQDWITPGTANEANVAILNLPPVVHATWGLYFQTIIIYIDVNFTPKHDIVAVNQRIDKCFSDSPFSIIRLIDPIQRLLDKSDL